MFSHFKVILGCIQLILISSYYFEAGSSLCVFKIYSSYTQNLLIGPSPNMSEAEIVTPLPHLIRIHPLLFDTTPYEPHISGLILLYFLLQLRGIIYFMSFRRSILPVVPDLLLRLENYQGGGNHPSVFIRIFVCAVQSSPFLLFFPKTMYRMFIWIKFRGTSHRPWRCGFRFNIRPEFEKYKLLYDANCKHMLKL